MQEVDDTHHDTAHAMVPVATSVASAPTQLIHASEIDGTIVESCEKLQEFACSIHPPKGIFFRVGSKSVVVPWNAVLTASVVQTCVTEGSDQTADWLDISYSPKNPGWSLSIGSDASSAHCLAPTAAIASSPKSTKLKIRGPQRWSLPAARDLYQRDNR